MEVGCGLRSVVSKWALTGQAVDTRQTWVQAVVIVAFARLVGLVHAVMAVLVVLVGTCSVPARASVSLFEHQEVSGGPRAVAAAAVVLIASEKHIGAASPC